MASVPEQLEMFTRKAMSEFPPRDKTADSLGEVEAQDGHRYYIKGDQNGRPIRASEWISTRICEAVAISAPSHALIERIDGTVVFGSRRIAGVAQKIETRKYLQISSEADISKPHPLQSILSSIYALDMFLYNEDRHLDNYLSVDDDGKRRLYAFDFSRALFWKWKWQHFPTDSQNTRSYGRLLRNIHGFDSDAAIKTLERLNGLATAIIEGFIKEMPTDWLQPNIQSEFVEWWDSAAKKRRIEELRKGIIDGTML